MLTIHHIICDGWSKGVLIRELCELYRANSTGMKSALAELPIQYADYTLWQRERLKGELLEQQLAYWKLQLGGQRSACELPTDHPRPSIQTSRGAHRTIMLPVALVEGLKCVSLQEGVTLFMTLLAAFQALLYRYTGQDEVVVGTPVANRTHSELEGLIGFFVNTLVLRTNLSGDPTFTELLRRVREVALGAYAHQDLPFEKLVEELQPERSLSRSPLFNLAFAFNNTPTSTIKLPGLTASLLKVDRGASKFDLSLSISEETDGLSVSATYCTDLFESATVEKMLAHLRVLVQAIVDNPAQRLSVLGDMIDFEDIPRDGWASGHGDKADRRPLPSPNDRQLGNKRPYQPPRDQLEHLLAQVWEEVLGIPQIGVGDNFFELGGHSLLAIQIIERVEQICGAKLHLKALFAEATIEHLAKSCRGRKDEFSRSTLLKIQAGGSRRPFFFVHGDFNGGGLYCLNLAKHIGRDQPFYALAADGYDDEPPPSSIEAMAALHLESLLSFQPRGPYLLGGFCNGALMAFEMARLLHEQGQRVDLLVLIHASARRVPYKPLRCAIESLISLCTVEPEKEIRAVQLVRYFFSQLNRLPRSEQVVFTLRNVRRMIELAGRLVFDGLGKRRTSPDPKGASVAAAPGLYTRHGAELALLYLKARDRYAPRKYPGRVTLLWPSEAAGETITEASENWRGVAAEVSAHPIPGEHFSCITTHHQALAERLKMCLEHARTSR